MQMLPTDTLLISQKSRLHLLFLSVSHSCINRLAGSVSILYPEIGCLTISSATTTVHMLLFSHRRHWNSHVSLPQPSIPGSIPIHWSCWGKWSVRTSHCPVENPPASTKSELLAVPPSPGSPLIIRAGTTTSGSPAQRPPPQVAPWALSPTLPYGTFSMAPIGACQISNVSSKKKIMYLPPLQCILREGTLSSSSCIPTV